MITREIGVLPIQAESVLFGGPTKPSAVTISAASAWGESFGLPRLSSHVWWRSVDCRQKTVWLFELIRLCLLLSVPKAMRGPQLAVFPELPKCTWEGRLLSQ